MVDTVVRPRPGVGSPAQESQQAPGLCHLVESSDGPLSGSVPSGEQVGHECRWVSSRGCGGQAKPVACLEVQWASCPHGRPVPSRPGLREQNPIRASSWESLAAETPQARPSSPAEAPQALMFKTAASDVKMDRGWLPPTEAAASLSLCKALFLSGWEGGEQPRGCPCALTDC